MQEDVRTGFEEYLSLCGDLWCEYFKFVCYVWSTLVSLKTKEKADSKGSSIKIDEAKEMVKRKIEIVDTLDPNVIEDLVKIIRLLNSSI